MNEGHGGYLDYSLPIWQTWLCTAALPALPIMFTCKSKHMLIYS